MTDLELWRAFADQAGVVYAEHAERRPEHRSSVELPAGSPYVEVRVDAGAGPKNTGYGYFFAALEFTPDGALIEMGEWE